jgi:hypothetical protein
MVKKADQEQDLDLTYNVRIKTWGKLSKHPDDIGRSLAQMLGLKFTDVRVTRGKRIYERSDSNDGWGPLAKVDGEVSSV